MCAFGGFGIPAGTLAGHLVVVVCAGFGHGEIDGVVSVGVGAAPELPPLHAVTDVDTVRAAITPTSARNMPSILPDLGRSTV